MEQSWCTNQQCRLFSFRILYAHYWGNNQESTQLRSGTRHLWFCQNLLCRISVSLIWPPQSKPFISWEVSYDSRAGMTVLDIGTGTGLLALLAGRALSKESDGPSGKWHFFFLSKFLFYLWDDWWLQSTFHDSKIYLSKLVNKHMQLASWHFHSVLSKLQFQFWLFVCSSMVPSNFCSTIAWEVKCRNYPFLDSSHHGSWLLLYSTLSDRHEG